MSDKRFQFNKKILVFRVIMCFLYVFSGKFADGFFGIPQRHKQEMSISIFISSENKNTLDRLNPARVILKTKRYPEIL